MRAAGPSTRVRRTTAAAVRDAQTAWSGTGWAQADEFAGQTADRERLFRCLDQLSVLQREAITLAFFGGHTYREVAGILGVPLGTVKARIRGALIKLRNGMLIGN